jgi:hypothetical protein
MNPPPFFHRSQVISLLLFSALAFASAFGLAYQQDRIRVAQAGQLAWFHFLYAEELKDDMAVIDWSKTTGNLDGLRAFQVKVNSKVVAEGGNRDFLPDAPAEGTAYHFPSGWTYRVTSKTDPPEVKEFILVVDTWPGPWLWGLLFFGGTFLTGGFLAIQTKNLKSAPSIKTPAPGSRSELAAPSVARASEAQAPDKSPPSGEPYLLIDKNYVIQRASARAAELLGENLDALMNRHLLDLMPDPLFIQAIEKGEEIKCLKPFPGRPHLSVFLKQDGQGCLVLFESPGESKSP